MASSSSPPTSPPPSPLHHSDSPPTSHSPSLSFTETSTSSLELEALTRRFNLISDAFQHHALELQPLKTQRTLTKQTREIFAKYAKHGSLDRLSHQVKEFLEGKMDRPGEELEVREVKPPENVDLFDPGEEEADSDEEDEDDAFIPPPPGDVNGKAKAESQTSPSSPGQHHPAVPARSHDPDSNYLVTALPFHPVDSVLGFDEEQCLPPAYVQTLSNVFALFDVEGRALLRHHTTKYGDEPVFRVGIRELLTSRLENVVKTPGETELGLAWETRSLLREVYESHRGQASEVRRAGGVVGEEELGIGELNEAERRILSGVCGIGEDSVEEFWSDLDVRRRAVGGMRVVIARKELEKMQEEKKRGEQEEAMRRAQAERERMEELRRAIGGEIGMDVD